MHPEDFTIGISQATAGFGNETTRRREVFIPLLIKIVLFSKSMADHSRVSISPDSQAQCPASGRILKPSPMSERGRHRALFFGRTCRHVRQR